VSRGDGHRRVAGRHEGPAGDVGPQPPRDGQAAPTYAAGYALHLVTDLPFTMSVAQDGDRAWAAHLMATSEPWLTLSQGYDECLAAVQPAADAELLVARAGSTPCGFVLLRPRGVAGSPYIVSIAVEASHRGRGVGSKMLDYVESHSRPGARHMFLCVSSFNTSARRLYERSGYCAVGELPDYVVDGSSEILMHKRLDRQ
jgi:[ribosomal protein S18]-alanine N-acetyltransferase